MSYGCSKLVSMTEGSICRHPRPSFRLRMSPKINLEPAPQSKECSRRGWFQISAPSRIHAAFAPIKFTILFDILFLLVNHPIFFSQVPYHPLKLIRGDSRSARTLISDRMEIGLMTASSSDLKPVVRTR